MASSVFFKFKSQKEPQRVAFDGTGIAVFELKREIITISRLGDGTDFDLTIYNEGNNEEYDDDTAIIPRSTTVIARRLPASKPGAGRAARYVSGRTPANARNSYRTEQSHTSGATNKTTGQILNGAAEMEKAQTDDDRIAAMFKLGEDQWEQQKQHMNNATPVYRPGGMKGKQANVPEHPPPAGYICYRCGNKGHWIQACPTNDDPNFDGRPRVKRTTGIPRSFLQTIERPISLSNDGLTDDARQPSGVMVNAEGDFVVAMPDKASWEQYQAKAQASAAQEDVAASGSKELQELGLECPIDKRMFVDPMKTPCCGKTYCNDCIENALVNNDLVCPGCSTEGVLIDNLLPDEEVIAKMKAYERQKIDERKTNENIGSPKSPSAMNKSDNVNSKPPAPSNPAKDGVQSTEKSKKRPADDDHQNDRKPPGPTPMEKAKSISSTVPQQVSNSFNQSFIAQMNALAPATMPFLQSDAINFPVNMSMPPVVAMQTQIMNPMLNPMMMQQFGGMGMGMTMGMPSMNGMAFPQHWPGNNQTMYGGAIGGMMNGYQTQSEQQQQQQNWQSMNRAGGYGNMQHGTLAQQQQQQQQQQFQQAYKLQNGGGGGVKPIGVFPNQQFSQPSANEEDNAYMRKPVNPHRHQGRQRKVRPTDYREL